MHIPDNTYMLLSLTTSKKQQRIFIGELQLIKHRVSPFLTFRNRVTGAHDKNPVDETQTQSLLPYRTV